MEFGRVKGFVLVVCVVVSLFVAVRSAGGPRSSQSGRNIQVYIVDAADSFSSWVGSKSAVGDGVYDAINDAGDRTKVKLAGETITPWPVSDSGALKQYMDAPPDNAVFINTHGEAVPMYDSYFAPYVSVTSPVDGASVEGSATVEAIVKTLPSAGLSGLPVVYWRDQYNPNWESSAWMALVDAQNCKYRASITLKLTDYYEIAVVATTVWGLKTSLSVSVSNHVASPPGAWMGLCRPLMRVCPYVFPWNGSGFEMDNNVLVGSNCSVLDYYMLERSLLGDFDGNYRLRLEERGKKRDFFDRVGLVAVDHAWDVEVGVEADGSMLTYSNPVPPSYSRLLGVEDAWQWLRQADGYYFTARNFRWANMSFEGVDVSSGAVLVLRSRSDDENSILVQRYVGVDEFETVAVLKPRAFWSTQTVNLTGLFPDFSGENRLRLWFDGECCVDFAGLGVPWQANVTVHEGEFVGAVDSSGINATYGDLQREDGVLALLESGYTVDLKFHLPDLNGSMLERDFIFVAKGYYEEEEEAQALAGGSPPERIRVDWKDWFDLIENRYRAKDCIWTENRSLRSCCVLLLNSK